MPVRIVIVVVLLIMATYADARRSRGGAKIGFATSACVSTKCFSRHTGGTWRHPLSAPMGRLPSTPGYNYPGTS